MNANTIKQIKCKSKEKDKMRKRTCSYPKNYDDLIMGIKELT